MLCPDCKSREIWQFLGILKTRLILQFTTIAALLAAAISSTAATALDTVGVTLLRTVEPGLTGTGINVLQAEAPTDAQGDAWEVNPSAVGQPASLFTWVSSAGTASTFPNGVGIESGHADGVAGNFYGTSHGVAPGVAHVDNYEASFFYESKIVTGVSINAKIVNQSFIFGSSPPQTTVDTAYDNYAAQNNTLFVSGIGNSGPPSAPATCYNGIGVGVSDGTASVGPTTDNGRSKPDLVAPGGVSSFSTPLVAGAAALLRQAGLRGDGGAANTNAAVDIRTIKALLLNGAIKPSNWIHTATAPLDTRFGAGVLNVFNSHDQLSRGKFGFVESNYSNVPSGAHPPGANTNNIASLSGWDFNSISASPNGDKINHYYFNLPSSTGNSFTLTATLVWNRSANASSAKDLNLFLYNTSNGALVASSVSTVDNVEHLYVTNLAAGRYDLQVWKKGGVVEFGSESYALAFESFATRLKIMRTGTNVVVSWPIAPDGFRLQSTSNLNPPISWNTVTNAPVVLNNENRVTLNASSSAQFFRLVRP